jgi:hypothetical protein
VTRIPPEHVAARALEDAFRGLGEQRAQTSSPRRRAARQVPRVAVIAITSLLLAAVAATGTKVLLGDGGAVDPDPTRLEGGLDPAPGYRQLALASTGDPVERQPWGLRLFKNAKGDTCLTLGRVVDGRLGVVRQGQFKELPARAAGMCAPLEERHVVMAVRDYPNSVVAGGRAVLFGIVDRTVTRLGLRAADGSLSAPAVRADGTFVVVRRGWNALRGSRLVVEGAAGSRSVALGG